jgi:hypothetical protein
MVQNGKFSAGTLILHIRLKVVDLPTLGMPTMPALTLFVGRPSSARGGGASAFMGGIARVVASLAVSRVFPCE